MEVYIILSMNHGELEGVEAVRDSEEEAKQYIEENQSKTLSRLFWEKHIMPLKDSTA